MHQILRGWIALVTLTACAGQHVVEDAPESPNGALLSGMAGEDASDPTININVTDASVADMMRTLSLSTGARIVIEPAANVRSKCAKLTIFSPRPMRPNEAVAVVEGALEPSGLRLEKTPEAFYLRLIPDVEPPETCRRPPPGMGPAPPGPVRPGPLPGRMPPSPPDPAAEEALHKIRDGIRRVSEAEVLVTKEARRLFYDSSGTLKHRAQVRIIPYVVEGEGRGFKLYGVRRNSPFADLGFRNGDIVTKIAEQEMTGPDKALEAYVKLRDADETTVELIRRGTSMEIRYRVVDELP